MECKSTAEMRSILSNFIAPAELCRERFGSLDAQHTIIVQSAETCTLVQWIMLRGYPSECLERIKSTAVAGYSTV